MVGVAQLVEHWVVAPAVAGSNPVTHPIKAYSIRGFSTPFFYPANEVDREGENHQETSHGSTLQGPWLFQDV